jgi:hypothetical protein
MKRNATWMQMGLPALLCGLMQATVFAGTPDDAQMASKFTPSPVIRDHLEVGARIYQFNLQDTVREGPNGPRNRNIDENYIGSLWGLDEIQDYIPRVYAQYALTPYFGVGATYDHIEARTLDSGDPLKNGDPGDGTLEIYGPLFYLFARYPNSTRFTPMAEVGWAYYFSQFNESPEWAAVGPGYRFEVDDTAGYYLALDVDMAITRCWHCDIYWRCMFGPEVDARAYFHPGNKVGREGSFPMEYQMAGLGVAYRF